MIKQIQDYARGKHFIIMNGIIFKPVGFVKNKVLNRADMPMEGAPSQIGISPLYARALKGLKRNSHVWVLCYFNHADRSVLQARPRKISSRLGLTGVFANRSPDRPNPVSITCSRLIAVKGRKLELESLDAVNGTPVLDIKPYSPGIDSVPAASRPDFSRKYRLVPDRFLARTLVRIIKNNAGGINREMLRAAALVFKFIRATGLSPENFPGRVETSLSGKGVDAVCALFNLSPSGVLNRLVTFRSAAPKLVVSIKGKRKSFTVSRKETDVFLNRQLEK